MKGIKIMEVETKKQIWALTAFSTVASSVNTEFRGWGDDDEKWVISLDRAHSSSKNAIYHDTTKFGSISGCTSQVKYIHACGTIHESEGRELEDDVRVTAKKLVSAWQKN